MFEAFSGYGSQSMALRRLAEDYPRFSFEAVGISEIDRYALQAYRAVHGDVTNYGDITRIDWDKVPDFDLLTYSFPCFVADTLILTDKGYKNIQDVTCEDKVLTHKNRLCKVATPMKRIYNGTLYDIGTMTSGHIQCTENHPFLIRRRYYQYCPDRTRMFRHPEWVKAKYLDESCYLGYAINQIEELPKWKGVTDNRWGHGRISDRLSALFGNRWFWYVMGRYVGDGWKKNSATGSGIIICCSDRNRRTLLDAVEHIGFHYTINEARTVCKVIISSNELNKFVDRYGYYAHGKRIDAETMNLPVDMLRGFLDGIMDSDGYVDSKGLHKVSSVSKELVYGIGQCVAKAYHRPFSIYKTKRNKIVTIENRVCNQRDTYTVSFKIRTGKQDKAFYEDGYIWFPIRSIISYTDECPVYNMSVEWDESYTANGCIVHNCTDISSAGKQQGFTEGSGTRSSLLWECRKAILAKYPQWLLMENVKALVSEKFLPLFREWEQWLASIGYRNYTQVLNAKDYGVPQNRERVFMVSTLSDVPYFFPKPLGVKCCLGDILEESVDGRYFLSEKMVDYIFSDSPTGFKGAGITDKAGTSATVMANWHKIPRQATFIACAVRGDGNRQTPETGSDVANAVTSVQKDSMVMQLANKVADMATKARGEECGVNVTADGRIVTFLHDKKRTSVQEYKIDSFGSYGQSLISARPSLMYDECLRIRKLTERECFRLMDLSESDIDKIQAAGISRTQQYKMAGNSIVVAVLYHIFRKMFIQPECETRQMKLF